MWKYIFPVILVCCLGVQGRLLLRVFFFFFFSLFFVWLFVLCKCNDGDVLFKDTLNTFYLWVYIIEHMVKDH